MGYRISATANANDMTIDLHINKEHYLPNETLRGSITYKNVNREEKLILILYWYTTGMSELDTHKHLTLDFSPPSESGQQEFFIQLPNHPYSFSGKLITLTWALKLSRINSEMAIIKKIFISPINGKEIQL